MELNLQLSNVMMVAFFICRSTAIHLKVIGTSNKYTNKILR